MPEYVRLYRAAENAAEAGAAMVFIASAPGVKRDGKDLDQSMWYLDNYRRNPVFLWAHDYFGRNMPLGRAEVYVEGGLLKCAVTFDQKDQLARQVEQKYNDGFLHAVSVGWEEIEIDGRRMYDLLDISAVPVPGDPDALKERQVAGMRGLYRQIQQILDAEDATPEAETPPETEPEGQRAADDPVGDTEPEHPLVADDINYRALSKALLTEVVRDMAEELDARMMGDTIRAGAAISKANLADLQRAADLITGVISRAAKPEPAEEDAPDEEEPQRAAEPEAARAADDEADEADNTSLEVLTRLAKMFETASATADTNLPL